MAKKDNLILLIVIALVGIGLFFFFNQDIDIQSLITIDIETQLKQDYTTLWADDTDGQINFAICRSAKDWDEYNTFFVPAYESPRCLFPPPDQQGATRYEDDLFRIEFTGGSYSTEGGKITLNGDTGASYTFTVKKNFKGQEVAILTKAVGNCGIKELTSGSIQERADIIILKPHTFDTSIYDVIKNGVNVNVLNIDATFQGKMNIIASCSGNGGVDIFFIGSKAEFSCDISSDEVWLTERYGSRVNINDLTFVPTKFCHEEHPATLRKLDEGETKIFPNPYFNLNTGETIPTNRELVSDEILTIRYATNFVEGVIDPLPPNQEYVCTSRGIDNKCNNWVIQQFVDPLQVVVQCQEDSQCPQPLKNQCPDYFTGCVDNLCTYDDSILEAPICKNEIVTIIKEIEIIQNRTLIPVTGKNVFIFNVNYPSSSFNFGVETFIGKVDFTCGIPIGTSFNFPNPNPYCYTGKADFEGKTFDLKDRDEFKIRDNINVKYFAGGSVKGSEDSSKRKLGLSSKFVFDVSNAFEVDLEPENKFILQNSDKEITLNVKNNLPENTNSFVKVKQIRKQTNQILEDKQMTSTLNEGINQIKVSPDWNGLGINRLEFEVFYVINVNNNEFLIKSDKIITNYNVVTEIPEQTEFIIVEKEIIKEVVVEVEVVKEIEVLEEEKERNQMIVKAILIGFGLLILLRLLKVI